jgi:hypothetical protein
MRPPGPYPSQSAAFLERELKNYLDLDSEWTSKSPEPASERVLKMEYISRVEHVTIVLGRYLLFTGSKDLRCYDLDLPGVEGEVGSTQLIASYDLSWYRRFLNVRTIVDKHVDERENVYESPLSMVCFLESFGYEDDPPAVL